MHSDDRIQRLLACLGDPSRFRVLAVLAEGDHCVTEIARRVGLSQSCTTRHLQVLLREDVVVRTRVGKRVLFRIADNDPRVTGILEWALLRGERPAPHDDGARSYPPADAGHTEHRDVAGWPRREPLGLGQRSRLPVAARRPHSGAVVGRTDTAPPTPASDSAPASASDDTVRARTFDADRSSAGNGPSRAAAMPDAVELEDFLL